MRRAIILIAALAVTACSSPEPTLTSSEAIERYQPVFDDVSTAVQDAYPGHFYAVDNVHDLVGGAEDCIVWIGDLENGTTDADDRYDYVAIIAPFIEDAGFGELDEHDPMEGVPYMPTFVAHDDLGTELRVTFENPGFSFSIVADVVDAPCGD